MSMLKEFILPGRLKLSQRTPPFFSTRMVS
jgi:hypothetical protein